MERRAACTYLAGDEFLRFSILASSHPRRVRRHGAASTQSAPDASAEDGNGESPGHVVVMEVYPVIKVVMQSLRHQKLQVFACWQTTVGK